MDEVVIDVVDVEVMEVLPVDEEVGEFCVRKKYEVATPTMAMVSIAMMASGLMVPAPEWIFNTNGTNLHGVHI